MQALHRRLLLPGPTLAARRPADASLPLLSRFRLVIVRHQPHPIPVTLLCPCALLVPHALQPTPAAVRLSSPRGVFPLGDFLPGTRMRMDSDPWAARETVLCAGLSARVRFRCAGYIPDAKPALLTRDTRRFLDVYRVCRCSVFGRMCDNLHASETVGVSDREREAFGGNIWLVRAVICRRDAARVMAPVPTA